MSKTWQVLVSGQVEQVQTKLKNKANYEGVWCTLMFVHVSNTFPATIVLDSFRFKVTNSLYIIVYILYLPTLWYCFPTPSFQFIRVRLWKPCKTWDPQLSWACPESGRRSTRQWKEPAYRSPVWRGRWLSGLKISVTVGTLAWWISK